MLLIGMWSGVGGNKIAQYGCYTPQKNENQTAKGKSIFAKIAPKYLTEIALYVASIPVKHFAGVLKANVKQNACGGVILTSVFFNNTISQRNCLFLYS